MERHGFGFLLFLLILLLFLGLTGVTWIEGDPTLDIQLTLSDLDPFPPGLQRLLLSFSIRRTGQFICTDNLLGVVGITGDHLLKREISIDNHDSGYLGMAVQLYV